MQHVDAVSNRIFGFSFVRHCISVRSQAHTLTEAEDGDDGRGRYAHALSSSSIRTLQGRITDELQSKSKSGRHNRHRSRFTEVRLYARYIRLYAC